MPILLRGGELDLVFVELHSRTVIDISGVFVLTLILLRLVVLDLSTGVQLEVAKLLLTEPVALVQVTLLDDSKVVLAA